MTLRDTVKSTVKAVLQRVLDWAKREQRVWGAYRTHYQILLDEERTLARLRKEAKDKTKAEKRGG